MSKKKNARKKATPKRRPHTVTLSSDMDFEGAMSVVARAAGCAAVSIAVDCNGEATWYPSLPAWSGMDYDKKNAQIVGTIKPENSEAVRRQLAFMRLIASMAQEVANTFEAIASNIESSSGITWQGELEEVPTTDVN